MDKPPTAAEAAANNEELGTFTNWLFRVRFIRACAVNLPLLAMHLPTALPDLENGIALFFGQLNYNLTHPLFTRLCGHVSNAHVLALRPRTVHNI